MRSPILLLAALALALIGCTRTAATTSSVSSTSTSSGAVTSTSGDSTGTTQITLPAGTEELPEALREEIARLIPITEELRGLEFLEPPTIRVITSAELTAEVIAEYEENYEDVEADEALYELLGLIGPDVDLLSTITALYGSSVIGYYSGEDGELVVTAVDEGSFTPMEKVTLVHELTHSLTDQYHSFYERLDALGEGYQFDEAAAYLALIEGDATLTELIYAQQLPPTEQQQFLEEAFSVDTTVFDQSPPFLQDSLSFPYESGTGFVQTLYEAGGYLAIDEAYADPPLSTEQVIEPADFGRDEPQVVPLESMELPGYEVAYGSTWGELGLRLMFDQVLGGADAAAGGWGGDSYDLFFNGSEAVFVMVYQGDEASDSVELVEALVDYIEVGMGLTEPVADGNGQAFTGDDYAFVSNSGGQVVFIAAGVPADGATARAWFSGF
ncbi:MAG TPA: hypothetical protein VIA81_00040 [Acidimicrobiia bacterium]